MMTHTMGFHVGILQHENPQYGSSCWNSIIPKSSGTVGSEHSSEPPLPQLPDHHLLWVTVGTMGKGDDWNDIISPYSCCEV